MSLRLSKHAIQRLRKRFAEFRGTSPVPYMRSKIEEALKSGKLKREHSNDGNEVVQMWEVYIFGTKADVLLAKKNKTTTVITVSPVTTGREEFLLADMAERNARIAKEKWDNRLKNRNKNKD